MASINDSQGGYLAARPTQNSSAHPGAQSQEYNATTRRRGAQPSNKAPATVTSVPGTVAGTSPLSIVFSESVTGNGGTISLSGDLGSTTLTVAAGASSGTGWNISSNTLNITAWSAYVSSGATLTFSCSANCFRTTEGFPCNSFSGTATRRAAGLSSDDAIGSAKALVGVTSTSGNYWVKNVDGSTARQLYCDMSTDGGGWTRYFNQPGLSSSSKNMPSNTASNYNLTSFNTDTDHYNAFNYMEGRRTYSTNGRLEYLLEQTTGNYKFALDSFTEGDPGVGSRNGRNINGISSGHFDFGWFNNSTNGYWYGRLNNTSSTCASSTGLIHGLVGYTTGWNNGYYQVLRGYHTDCCSSGGCGDHCPNTRRYWYIFPWIGTQENCYGSYNSWSGYDGGGTVRVYFREKGTLPSSGY